MNFVSLQFLISRAAPMLQPDLKFASAEALLLAIASNESSLGLNTAPRIEKVYDVGGKYCTFEQKVCIDKYGYKAAASYGIFQILYATACDLGFDNKPWNRPPEELAIPEVNIFYAIEYIKKRCLQKGAKTIELIFDAYNSGNCLDQSKPVDYIRNGTIAYNKYNKVDYVGV